MLQWGLWGDTCITEKSWEMPRPEKVEISPGEFAPRWRKGTKLVPTERPLKYASASAVPEWFEEAKKRHRSEWIRIVKEKAGGGTRG